MPAWAFVGYLIFAWISLTVALYVAQGALHRRADPAPGATERGARAVFGALVMMIPLFYLVYAGLLPLSDHGRPGKLATYLLPLLWAHLAIDAWKSGGRSRARFLPGIAFLLSTPVLFLAVWTATWTGARVPLLWPNALLFLASLAAWLQTRACPE